MYYSMTNEQGEMFNRTLLSALSNISDINPRIETYSAFHYIRVQYPLHRIKNIAPFELKVSKFSRSIAVQGQTML